ncbi:hypothetical protein HPB47_020026 [Ixodes persulcatus]|uniref:Uncharacterized protein n=1 Tax=Ixodes persulcatus TaxID=34615 RepID=A0AC60QGK9_IXOPE|nr:hypothetical protein HPB47_020026 [Ixodes persulcatus]
MEHLRLASQVTEFLWVSLRVTLPKKKARALAPCPDFCLGNASALETVIEKKKPKPLTADKKGGFVALPEGLFGEKSRTAILKSFSQVEMVPINKINTVAMELCEGLRFNRRAKKVLASTKLSLE